MTKKIIIALIGMAALYGCKPKDPCDSEVKSDVDKYFLDDDIAFSIKNIEGKNLLLSQYKLTDISFYNDSWQPIIMRNLGVSINDAIFLTKSHNILQNSLLGLGEEFQTKIYIKFKDDVDTLNFWANVKQLTCNKTYTDRLQVQQNNLPFQNLILNNGEVKYGIRQPYETIVQIIK
jgi:hypothetical protein